MKKRSFRSLCWLLVLVMVAIQLPVFQPAPVQAAEITDIQDGVTLHCWNWSFKNIEEKMATIAALGYTAIQTSPIQQAKQATDGYPSNDWWVFYQPASFSIDNTGTSALGTKADFESMCKTAHEYGIKVIVDVVANHMGNTDTGSGISSAVIDDLRSDPDCWHDVTKNTNNYSSRLEVTQYCMAGLPDLNTANDKVQTYVLNFLKECIDAGADGFRFDAVKHIETPDDGDLASDFWPTVIDGAEDYAESSRGIDLYCYGELLDNPGGSLSPSAYTEYMSITDNGWSNNVLSSVVGKGSTLPRTYYKGEADELVLWAESHDTFADGTTADASEESINKAWALIAARADAMSLYLARPANMSQLLGAASNTAWSYPEVAAVNKFHNQFVGQSEYVAHENGIAYVERGTSGVVLVNCKGGSADISVTANTMADGTYTDQISGNTFTVADGKITGTIGSATGIAVVMEGEVCTHAAHDSDGFCTECRANVGHSYDENRTCSCGDVKVGDRTIYLVSASAWSTVNFYAWYDDINIFTGAWPGNAMTHVEGNLYSCTVPADIPNIIFNDGGSIQTEDLVVPADKDLFDFMTRKWSLYSETSGSSCSHSSHNTDGICAECGVEVGHSYGDNATCVCGAKDPTVRTVYFTGSNWSAVNFYSWYDGGSEITAAWPGDAMTDEGNGLYSCIVPADAVNIIFNDGGSKQTDNLTLSDKNLYDFSSKQWSTHEVEEPTEPPTEPPAETPTEAPTTEAPTAEPKPANNTGVIVVCVAAGIAVLAVVVALIFRKKK